MQKIFTLLSLMVLTAFAATAQIVNIGFVNGSLEPSAVPASNCAALTNSIFNSIIHGVYAYGPAGTAFFDTSSCGDGPVQNGSYAVGLKCTSLTNYDAIAIRTKDTLRTGNMYTIFFYNEASQYVNPAASRIGYNTDSSGFGTFIQNIDAPSSLVRDNWAPQAVSFVPLNDCWWITFEATGSATAAIIIDSFNIFKVRNVEVNNISSVNYNIHISPNPAKSNIVVGVNDMQFGNDINIAITDITGRTMQQNEFHINGNRNIPLNVAELPEGLYIMHITDGQRFATQKLIISR
jgi:hypothetical protein